MSCLLNIACCVLFLVVCGGWSLLFDAFVIWCGACVVVAAVAAAVQLCGC